MVKSPSSNAKNTSSIPGPGSKIPEAMGLLNLHSTTAEPMSSRADTPQQEKPTHHNADPEQPKYSVHNILKKRIINKQRAFI